MKHIINIQLTYESGPMRKGESGDGDPSALDMLVSSLLASQNLDVEDYDTQYECVSWQVY